MDDVELVIERGRAAITDADVWEACYSLNKWVSRAEIAAALGRKPAPALVMRIESLVAKGWLMRGFTVLPNGSKRYSYMAVEA